jgi:hypothetical protein
MEVVCLIVAAVDEGCETSGLGLVPSQEEMGEAGGVLLTSG